MEKHKAYHNLGNTFMNDKKYQEAVESYKEALRNNPKDDETRYNLALAKDLLEKNPPQGGGGDDDKEEEDKEKKENEENKDEGENEEDGDKENEKEQPSNNQVTTKEQPSNTDNKVNKEKNVENYNIYSEFKNVKLKEEEHQRIFWN